MKTIRNIIIINVMILAVSCSDNFLDLNPPSNANVGSFYKTENDLEQAVVAAYAALQSRGQYARNYLYFMESRSDNSYVEDITKGAGEEGNIDLFREATTNSYLYASWFVSYTGIQRCNIVLNRIQGIAMDEDLKTVRIGEVKFIRALTYFNLVRMWGGVPVVTNEIESVEEAYNHSRQSVSEVYDLIIQDLIDASVDLPADQPESGRVTQGAALSLLGKVYLTLEQWSDAVITLKQVETLGYQILPNFADVFDVANQNNAESIFEVQFKSGAIGEGSLFLRLHTPLGNSSLLGGIGGAGVGDNLPTQDLFDAFSTPDMRLPVTVGALTDGRLHTNKYNGLPFNTNDEDNNFIVLRYADVILMLAEAQNEVAYVADGEAFTNLNIIRNRAGLSQLSSAELPDQASFRDALSLERRLELAFENHRWFDLLRTKKAIEVMGNYVEDRAPLVVGNHQVLYPIPQTALDVNPNLEQNLGY